MRILVIASYIYNRDYPEFTKNKTGYGMMVSEIVNSVQQYDEVYLVTNVITKGYKSVILRHTWKDVIFSSKFGDWLAGLRISLRYKSNIREKLLHLYYRINMGYLRKTLKEIKPDIVHIHGTGCRFDSAINSCKQAGVKYIVTLHGLIGFSNYALAAKQDIEYEKRFLLDAHANNVPITVVSTGVKRKIEEYYGEYAKNITVVLNGTKTERFSRVDSQYANLRAKYNIPNNTKICTVIGSLCKGKNQIEIINALAFANSQYVVLFCGYDKINNELNKKAMSLGIENRVIFLGFTPQEDIHTILEQADLNIVASISEGFGLSIIEAFSHGIPTVTFSDLDAIPDLYNDKAMMITERCDAKQFSKVIDAALSTLWDKEYIIQYSKRFSLDEMARKYHTAYRLATNTINNDGKAE